MARFPVLFLLLLLTACASAPRQELQNARLAVARAYHAGAEQMAPLEYRQAAEALQLGEALVRRGEYKRAGALLPEASLRAQEALERTEEELKRAEAKAAEALKSTDIAPPLPDLPPPPEPLVPSTTKPEPEIRPPGPQPGRPAVPSPEPLTSYSVDSDTDLWNIAARPEVYDDPALWPLLYQANRDQIKDPRQVYPGQVLRIPRGQTEAELQDARRRASRSDFFSRPRFSPETP